MAASIIMLLPLVSVPVVELNALRASCGYVDLQSRRPLGCRASRRWLHTYCCNKFVLVVLGSRFVLARSGAALDGNRPRRKSFGCYPHSSVS